MSKLNRFPFWLGSRLSLRVPADSRGDGDGRFGRRSPGVSIAMLGVGVSVIVMMMSVAVVNGFKQRISDKVMGFNSQITVTADRSDRLSNTGGVLMTVDSAMIATLAGAIPPGAEISPDVVIAGILKTSDDFEGIVLRGPEYGATHAFVRNALLRGRMPAEDDAVDINEIVVSALTARKLDIDTASRVDAHFFNNGRIVSRRLTVVGVYDTGFGDYDRIFAFAPNRLAVRMAGAPAEPDVSSTDFDNPHAGLYPGVQCTTLEINGLDTDSIPVVASRIHDALLQLSLAASPGNPLPLLRLDTVYTLAAQYFSWLDLLDTNVAVILTLMALVSVFTLISSLFILILERVSMIGTLKSLGADNATIRRIFVYMTMRIVIAGIAVGNAVALAIIILQQRTHFVPLDPAAYYLDYVPMELGFGTWITLNAGALALSLAALLIPSRLVAGLRPADTMRFD